MTEEGHLPVTQWKMKDAGHQDIKETLVKEFGIHRIISHLILNRHVRSLEDAHRYLHPSLNDLHSPFLMQDMKTGVNRLIRAILAGEDIVVYGDYDADGITSVGGAVQVHQGADGSRLLLHSRPRPGRLRFEASGDRPV